MPNSRKRIKKPMTEEKTKQKTSNIVKSPWGKAVIILLAGGFLVSIIAGLIVVLVQSMQA